MNRNNIANTASMKKLITIYLLLLSIGTFGQKKEKYVPMKTENWEFKPGTVEFLEYKDRSSMKLLTSSDAITLKNLNFTNGIIEYDMEPLDPRFTSIYFRWKDSKENECFYFRTERAGNAQAVDAIQYAPHVGGVNLWDMLFHFQSNADFKASDWNHVKLVISGEQLRIYVNDMDNPSLEVPKLEGNVAEGSIRFDGQVIISNLIVRHDEVEGLSPQAGLDPTAGDPRYLRKWLITEPISMAQNIDFNYDHFPNDSTTWEGIEAERRGLVNLTRKFGQSDSRRIIWLKTTVQSSRLQERILNLGFSDEVWVFINNQPLYIDKNNYNTPIMKPPDGRCSVENTSFILPLSEGENQLLIGVANSFYGWGIVARLDKLADLKLQY